MLLSFDTVAWPSNTVYSSKGACGAYKGSMGLYAEQIFPRLMDWVMSGEEFQRLRGDLLKNARGNALEIGFGTGLNLTHYPPGRDTALPRSAIRHCGQHMDDLYDFRPDPSATRSASGPQTGWPLPLSRTWQEQ